jgi:hypothetical protein
MMRLPISIIALLGLASCHQREADQETQGWQLMPSSGAYEGNLTFNFADGQKTAFVARCNGSPWFMLYGGDYSNEPDYFTLNVDGHSWTLHVSRSEHGRGLFVDTAGPANAVAAATRRIEFQVGNWKRDIRPGPELAKFVQACKS